MSVIRAEIGPTSTPKGFEKSVVWRGVEQFLIGRLELKNGCWKSIYEITGRLKSIIPISKGSMGMGQQSKTKFNNMAMLMFYGSILLVSVGTRDTMHNSTVLKFF